MAGSKKKDDVKRQKVVFSVEAPKAKKVCLMGDFNGWDEKKHPMNKKEPGHWTKAVMLFPGRYEYRYQVDGQWWNDPENDAMCYNCFGSQNNVIQVKKKKV